MSIVGGSKAKVRAIQSRAHGRNREALDRDWLRRCNLGKSTAEIAAAEGVTKRTVQLALARARAAEQEAARAEADDPESPIREETASPRRPWWLELVPLFPIGGFTPNSQCPHHGPIRPGSMFCCMVCSTSGFDDHPYLQRDPKTDPPPEPVPVPAARAAAAAVRSAPPPRRETRKERRRRQPQADPSGREA